MSNKEKTEKLPREKHLSHRLRGYVDNENSASGLQGALEQNVANIEVDVRITKDDVLVLAHDPYFETLRGEFGLFANLDFQEACEISKFPIETLESFLKQYVSLRSKKKSAFLHIDIKFSGYEKETFELISTYLNTKEFYIVSWLPEVLLKYNEISSEVRLCLSHIPAAKFRFLYWFLRTVFNQNTTPVFAKIAKLHSARRSVFYEALEFRHKDFIRSNQALRDKNVICVFQPYASSDLLRLIVETKGYVCIPVKSLSTSLVEFYKSKKVKIASFSYASHEQAVRYDKTYQLDLYYSNYRL